MTEPKQETQAVSHLGDVISDGEGDYDSYNTGTKYGKLHSGHVALEKMTVNQILAASKRTDRSRIFAAGKYQIITPTLEDAKRRVPLTGNELFTPEFQEHLFLAYFLTKKHKEVGAYITQGKGTSEDATYGTSKEWMSIEVPAGRLLNNKRTSNGRQGYMDGDGVNHAKRGSGAKVKLALEQARAAYAGGGPIQTPLSDQVELGPTSGTTEAPTEREGRVDVTVGALVPEGHIISNSVGRNGTNHPDDVGTVQQALTTHGHSPGAIDKKAGPRTIAAITSFQNQFLKHADGLVELGKATEQHLMAAQTQEIRPDTTTTTTEPQPQTQTQPQTPSTTTPVALSTVATSATLQELMAQPRLTTEQIAQARALIAKEPVAARGDLYEQLQAKTQYLNQRDGKTMGMHDGKYQALGDWMCNLTALAMCLEYLGVANPYPQMMYPDALEKIRVDNRMKDRTDPRGWGAVATHLGVRHDMIGGGRHPRAWWQSTLEPHLRSGKSIMCSIGGHIVRIQNVAADGVVADDPFGRSKLGAGAARGWREANHKDATGQGGKRENAGEDITWPWQEVEQHTFLWISTFGR